MPNRLKPIESHVSITADDAYAAAAYLSGLTPTRPACWKVVADSLYALANDTDAIVTPELVLPSIEVMRRELVNNYIDDVATDAGFRVSLIKSFVEGMDEERVVQNWLDDQ